MIIDTLRYELPPEGTTLLGYIVRRMHKTEWLIKAAESLQQNKRTAALEAIAIYAVASATSFGSAYYQPSFNRVGEVVRECDPQTGALVAAKLLSDSPAYQITYSAEMKNGDLFQGSETILGTTIGWRGLGMPAPSKFSFKSEAYEAEFQGTLTSELALALFSRTKIRAYGSLDFTDSHGNEGHLELDRHAYVTVRVNDQPASTHALARTLQLEKLTTTPQPT